MFDWLKSKKNKQAVCLLSETNSVQDNWLDADILHAESLATTEAWGLDSRQQCKDEKTGQYIQFISSVSCNPVKIYRNGGKVEARDTNTALLSSQTEDREMVFIQQGKGHDGRLLWIGICMAMLTLTVCVVVLLKVAG